MALPNGDLITTVFDPQMAYPVDKRMQVDTLNSRDSMSMFIRWEGMEVYVLENKTKYILQGGRSNEFWKEQGTGSGTGGTTFVGQFATADLLPTSGRSAGDYAFVGTGDDFVQYNWDNIANEWVMAEGQTDMASEFFHIGYKTPLRRPVIFPLFPKDVLVQTSGDFVFAPETSVARFIFVGEVDAIRGIETAAADREIKLVNRTGSDIPLKDKASGIPSGSGMDFGGTDYTWVNGSEITLKGNGTYWQLAPNNQIAFSDHLDSVNAQVSVGSDGLKTIYNILDRYNKRPVEFRQVIDIPSVIDGIINIETETGEYFERIINEYNLADFNVLPKNSAFLNAANFNYAQTVIPHNSKVILPSANYDMDDVTITKSGVYDFSGVTINNNFETIGNAITIESAASFVNIVGLNLVYSGLFYRSTANGYVGPLGVTKYGIYAKNEKTLCDSVRVSGFSHAGIYADITNKSLYLNSCISSKNGYAGAFSVGMDFQVIGGEYNENGGSNAVGDGYGVIGNISTRGNFKVIGVTAQRNATRNIDSHQGHDIIIIGNHTEDAGQPLPQWFNKTATDGLNIRVTQRIDKCIISGNIAKRGTLAGVSLSGALSDSYLRNIIISDNIFEDNLNQIHIRQLETNKLNILGNQCINTSGNVAYDLSILPFTDTSDRCFIKDLKIIDNSFDQISSITLSSFAGSVNKSNISINGNTFPSMTIILNTIDTNINMSTNVFEGLSVSGGTLSSIINFQGNIMDKKGVATAFTFNSSFNGKSLIINNIFQNGGSTTLYTASQNTDFINNQFVNYATATTGIRCLVGNVRIIGNNFTSPNSITNPIRFTANPTVVVRDNSFTGAVRIDHSGGNKTSSNKVTFDPIEGIYDLEYTTANIPITLGDYSFKRGDLMRNTVTLSNTPVGWVCITAGAPGTWMPYGLINPDIGKTLSGNTLQRPDVTTIGYRYFDTTLGVPLWWNGSSWVTSAPNASTTQRGIIEQATDSETITGTDTERAVSPANLQAKLNSLILSATATLDFPVISAGESAQLTATVTGVALLDPVLVSGPANIYNSNNSTIDAWVSSANTVTVRVRNNGASSIDPGEGQFKIKVFK